MASSTIPQGHYPQGYSAHPGTTPSYTLGTGTPYLQPYTHPYSVRLHHGFDYPRDTSWSYYDTQTPIGGESANPPHPLVHSQMSPRSSKKTGSAHSPTRKSPPVPPTQGTPEGGCSSNATPVAVRATVTAHHKRLSPSEGDEGDSGSWKASPTQEVPDYPDYSPYITPSYPNGTSTKVSVFAFDASDGREPHHTLQDQHVPSGHAHHREAPWYAHAFVRWVFRKSN